MLGDASNGIWLSRHDYRWRENDVRNNCESYTWILPRKDAVRYCCYMHVSIGKVGVAGRFDLLSRVFTCALILKFHRLTGAEGELQLWPLLPASEWKSREIPGRGTPSWRLSFQWTRRVSGGKETRSFFILSIFFIFLISDRLRLPRIDRANSVHCHNREKTNILKKDRKQIYLFQLDNCSRFW